MRWVFYSLLTLNIVYLVWNLVAMTGPRAEHIGQTSVAAASRQLQLLDEFEAAPGVASSSVAGRQSLCPVIGHWSSAADAADTLKDLQHLGYAAAIRPVKVEKERLHWVYPPPYATRKKALKVLQEMQAKGVDSFIVGEGGDENAISLGFFSSAESAEGLRMKMRNAGYPAEIRNTAREVTEYWVYIDSGQMPDDGSGLRGYLNDHSGLRAENSSCAPVAGPKAGPEPASEAEESKDSSNSGAPKP